MSGHISLSCCFLLVLLLAGCGGASVQIIPPSSQAWHRDKAHQAVDGIAEGGLRVHNPDQFDAIRTGRHQNSPTLPIHTVVRGETLGHIAEQYRVSLTALAHLNQLEAPYVLTIGRKLQIPPGPYRTKVVQVSRRQAVAAKKTADSAVQKLAEMAVVRVPRRPVQILANTAVAEETVNKTEPARQKTSKPQDAGGQFIWPVRGRVVSQFGSKTEGVRNDGINISAKVGSPVKATDHGTVVYAGNKLSGFGRILIVRHDKGFMSAYAHNQALLVKRGDTVRQGQVIARSGKSGNVTSGQLHFEIRKGGKPLNPLDYLRG